MAYLTIDQGQFSYEGSKALYINIEKFQLEQGQALVVCGNSGSGKSTLTQLLNGISPEYIEGDVEGQFEIAGLVAGQNGLNDYVEKVGSVFQNPRTQHFTLNTTDEIVLPCENMGMDRAAIQERLDKVVAITGIQHLLDRPIFDLSGGEKQLIALASTLMLNPQVLILDEVSSNLDHHSIQLIKDIIKGLKADGVTLIIVDHRLEWTVGIGDRYIKLADGSIEKDWSAAAFSNLTEADLADLGLRTNRPVQSADLHFSLDSLHQPVLSLDRLSVGYHQALLSGIKADFSFGEVTAFIGPIGVGKSTLGETIGGLREALAGQVTWQGQRFDKKALLEKSFIVMQDVNYQLFHHTVWHEVTVGTRWQDADSKDEEHPVNRLLDQLNIGHLKNRHPMNLSGGEKQRVLIASAIASGKQILIFDEPTSGFDYEHMKRFGELLQVLKEEELVMIIFTHDFELAKQWCDRVVDIETYRT